VSILRPPPLPKDSTLVRQIGDPHVYEIFLGAFNRKIGLIKPVHCSRCVLDDVVDGGLSTESFGQDVECGGCGCPQTFASRYLSPASAVSVDRTTKPVLVECGLPETPTLFPIFRCGDAAREFFDRSTFSYSIWITSPTTGSYKLL
jgi:hypothetical protein